MSKEILEKLRSKPKPKNIESVEIIIAKPAPETEVKLRPDLVVNRIDKEFDRERFFDRMGTLKVEDKGKKLDFIDDDRKTVEPAKEDKSTVKIKVRKKATQKLVLVPEKTVSPPKIDISDVTSPKTLEGNMSQLEFKSFR